MELSLIKSPIFIKFLSFFLQFLTNECAKQNPILLQAFNTSQSNEGIFLQLLASYKPDQTAFQTTHQWDLVHYVPVCFYETITQSFVLNLNFTDVVHLQPVDFYGIDSKQHIFFVLLLSFLTCIFLYT